MMGSDDTKATATALRSPKCQPQRWGDWQWDPHFLAFSSAAPLVSEGPVEALGRRHNGTTAP